MENPQSLNLVCAKKRPQYLVPLSLAGIRRYWGHTSNQREFSNPEMGESCKINPFSVAQFSISKSVRQVTQLYHAFHHKLTTKKPRCALYFLQKPQQKCQFTTAEKTTRK